MSINVTSSEEKELEQLVKDLTFKVNTTPRWLGKFIYERMLINAKTEYRKLSSQNNVLDLCYEHRQEPNHSHFANHNCDYCKIENRVIALNSKLESSKPKEPENERTAT